jgi:hypothetical protein
MTLYTNVEGHRNVSSFKPGIKSLRGLISERWTFRTNLYPALGLEVRPVGKFP